jgi:hypothetical protein
LRNLVFVLFGFWFLYSGEYDVCDVTLNVYPHQLSWSKRPMSCYCCFRSRKGDVYVCFGGGGGGGGGGVEGIVKYFIRLCDSMTGAKITA